MCPRLCFGTAFNSILGKHGRAATWRRWAIIMNVRTEHRFSLGLFTETPTSSAETNRYIVPHRDRDGHSYVIRPAIHDCWRSRRAAKRWAPTAKSTNNRPDHEEVLRLPDLNQANPQSSTASFRANAQRGIPRRTQGVREKPEVRALRVPA